MMQSFWAIAAAACFSIMAAFVKVCAADLGSFELVFYRSVFGALFICTRKKSTPVRQLCRGRKERAADDRRALPLSCGHSHPFGTV